MDTRTGEILTEEQYREIYPKGLPPHIKEMLLPPTKQQMARRPYPKVGRNEPCPCGSGKKFKKCCLQRGEKP